MSPFHSFDPEALERAHADPRWREAYNQAARRLGTREIREIDVIFAHPDCRLMNSVPDSWRNRYCWVERGDTCWYGLPKPSRLQRSWNALEFPLAFLGALAWIAAGIGAVYVLHSELFAGAGFVLAILWVVGVIGYSSRWERAV